MRGDRNESHEAIGRAFRAAKVPAPPVDPHRPGRHRRISWSVTWMANRIRELEAELKEARRR